MKHYSPPPPSSRLLHLFMMMTATLALALKEASPSSRSHHRESGVGSIVAIDPDAMARLVGEGGQVETLHTSDPPLGSTWFEGPLWRQPTKRGEKGHLLFSDAIGNQILEWEEGQGTTLFLDHSGCYTDMQYCEHVKIGGSNGLFTDPNTGHVIVAEQGERRIVRLETNGSKVVLASHYKGKRLNSPNDVVMASNGDLYFTDPPYGLTDMENDPHRELDFSGVFRVPAASMSGLDIQQTTGSNQVQLLTDAIYRPNGIALSPDESHLYVGESNFGNASWYSLDKEEEEGSWGPPLLVAHEKDLETGEKIGSSDGIKLDTEGNLWATCSGGVLLLDPQGHQLGLISTADWHVSNIALGGDGHLYITGADFVIRMPIKAQSALLV